MISPICRLRQAMSCSSSSAAVRLTWVEVISKPQSSAMTAVTFRALERIPSTCSGSCNNGSSFGTLPR